MNIIDEWILILLLFGVYSCLLIFFGYVMGNRLPKIKFVRGEPIPEADDTKTGPVDLDFEDPYHEALFGPPKKNERIETL